MASVFMILFANMLVRSVTENYRVEENEAGNVISYMNPTGEGGFTEEDQSMFYLLNEVDTVKTAKMMYVTSIQMQFSSSSLASQEIREYLINSSYGEEYVYMPIVFIDDGTYRELLTKHDIDPDPFFEYGSELCIVNNSLTMYTESGRVIYEGKGFSKLPDEIRMDINDENRPSFVHSLKPVAEIDLSDDLQISEPVRFLR